jgi:hypothetical protein
VLARNPRKMTVISVKRLEASCLLTHIWKKTEQTRIRNIFIIIINRQRRRRISVHASVAITFQTACHQWYKHRSDVTFKKEITLLQFSVFLELFCSSIYFSS